MLIFIFFVSRAANSYAHRVEFGDQDARLMLVPKYSGTINTIKITGRQIRRQEERS